MIERPIEESHEQKLKTILGISEGSTLPARVVDLYWKTARTCRKIGEPIRPSNLVVMAMMLDMAPPPPPVSFIDEIESKNVAVGQAVLAKFRNQWRWGVYVKYEKGLKKVVVQLSDESAEERKFAVTSVRLPSKEELEGIGESNVD